MIRKMMLAWLVLAGLMSFAAPAAAQDASAQLRSRGAEVMAMLRGDGDPAEMFTAEFLAQVPVAQLRTISQQLTGQYGAPRGLRIDAQGPDRGVLHIETERGAISMNIALEPQPPHRITGLLVTNAQLSGDSLEAVVAEIRALPGQTAVAVARLDETGPLSLSSHQPDRALAIGSTFKLFILAELGRQVQAGERRWNDVVNLDERSLPSGMLQSWPQGSPLTLHTLAALMISISDNTATDALLEVVGRENVESMMTTIGVSAAGRNRPFLSTREMFILKQATDMASGGWLRATEAQRREALESSLFAASADELDISRFGGAPSQIEALEWFASPADLVRTLDWLRRHGGDEARAIMAISPGGPASLRQNFTFVGYKGGSEPGVISLSWLVRNRAGIWLAVTGSWNNPAAAVDEARFAGLMQRLLQLVR